MGTYINITQIRRWCFCLVLLGVGMVLQAQNAFILLDDPTGIERTTKLTQLDTNAQRLINLFPQDSPIKNQFKVFDFGFYLHHDDTKGGYPEAIERMRAVAAAQAPYYLIFGKESNEEGLYQKFWVELKLPSADDLPCFTTAKEESIQALIEKEVNQVHLVNNKRTYDFHKAEIAAMKVLERFLDQLINCCPENATNARNNECSYCFYTPAQMAGLLGDRGMLEFEGENLSIEITEDIDYGNSNFETEHGIKITNKYGDDTYEWNLTNELNNYLGKINGAKARVLYFGDLTCPNFEEYLEGNYPNNTNALGRNNSTSFFEEIIIFDFDGKQQVFFRFEGDDQSDESILWSMKHVAIGKRGGLVNMAACLEIEQCFGDHLDWITTWIESKMFSVNWDFIKTFWESSTGEYGNYGWRNPMAKILGDYLNNFNLNSRTSSSIKSFEEVAINNKVDRQIAKYADDHQQIFDALSPLFPNSGYEDPVKFMEICVGIDYLSVKPVLLEEFVTNGYLTFVSNTGQFISIKYEDIQGLDFATGGEFYKETGELIPIGTLTYFTIKEGEQIVTYGNCAGGGYYSQITATSCNGFQYDDDYDGAKRPVIIRPCRKDGVWNIHIVAKGENEFNFNSNNITYDFLANDFFTITASNYIVNGIFKSVTNFRKYFSLSNDFNNPLFLKIVQEHEEYANYDKLSGFYLNGLSYIIEGQSEYFRSCIEETDIKGMISLLDLINKREKNPLTHIYFHDFIKVNAYSNLATKVRNTLFQLDEHNYFGTIAPEDKVFDLIPLFYKRVELVNQYQSQIDALSDDDLINGQKLAFGIVDKLMPCELELLNWNYPLAKAMIKELLSQNLNWVPNSVENVLLFLLDKIPEDKYSDFLVFLEITKIDNTEFNGWLWSSLANGVDNSFIDNNGKLLLKKLSEIYVSAVNAGGSDNLLSEGYNNLTTLISKIEVGDNYQEEDVKLLSKSIIPYNYEGIFNNFTTYRYGTLSFIKLTPSKRTIVDVTQFGELSINNDTKTVFDLFKIRSGIGTNTLLNPFDPIIIDPTSTYGITNEFTDGELKIYPAIILYYFNHESIAQSRIDLAITSFDLLTLAVPIGNVGKMGRIIAYMDKASSIFSIAGTATREDHPELSTILNASSAVLGLGSLAGGGVNTIKNNLKNIEDSGDYTKVIELIKKNSLTADKSANLNQLLNSIIDGSQNSIDALSSTQKAALKNLIQDDEFLVLVQNGSVSQSKIDDAIKRLDGLIDISELAALFARIKSSIITNFPNETSLVNWIEELWNKGDFVVKKTGANKIEIEYNGTVLAKLEEGEEVNLLDLIEDGAIGNEVKLISSEGKYAVTCKPTGCEIGQAFCFPTGTLIASQVENKAIETIKKGDIVYAFDESKQKPVKKKVIRTFKRTWYRFKQIITSKDTILTTPNHPFYIPTLKRYIDADSIKKGMKLLTLSGILSTINNITTIDTTLAVYNFEVEGFNNYYVGNEGILVHNYFWDWIFNEVGITQEILKNFDDNIKRILASDLTNSNDLKSFLKGYNNNSIEIQKVVDAWYILRETPELYRRSPENIEVVKSFLNTFPNKGDEIVEQLKVVTDPDFILEGLKNGVLRIFRLPTQSDKSIIRHLREVKYKKAVTEKPTRNAAYANGTIEGNSIDLESISGGGRNQDIWSDFGNFEPVSQHYEGPLGYINHTEQKIADYIWSIFKNNPNIEGTIEIISQKNICSNCGPILDYLQQDFRNLKILRINLNNQF